MQHPSTQRNASTPLHHMRALHHHAHVHAHAHPYWHAPAPTSPISLIPLLSANSYLADSPASITSPPGPTAALSPPLPSANTFHRRGTCFPFFGCPHHLSPPLSSQASPRSLPQLPSSFPRFPFFFFLSWIGYLVPCSSHFKLEFTTNC